MHIIVQEKLTTKNFLYNYREFASEPFVDSENDTREKNDVDSRNDSRKKLGFNPLTQKEIV